MSELEALLLGIVQGLTEFLPISSSGHLILVPWLQDYTFLENNEDFNQTFDVALHAGTLVAAVSYFRHEVVLFTAGFLRTLRTRRIETVDERLSWAIAIAHGPGGDRRRARRRLDRRSPRGTVDDRDPADRLRALLGHADTLPQSRTIDDISAQGGPASSA